MDIVHAHMSADVPKVRSERDDVPEDVECVVEKLLQKDPNDRFQSACGLWKQLVAIREKRRREKGRKERGEKEEGVKGKKKRRRILKEDFVRMSQMLHLGME